MDLGQHAPEDLISRVRDRLGSWDKNENKQTN